MSTSEVQAATFWRTPPRSLNITLPPIARADVNCPTCGSVHHVACRRVHAQTTKRSEWITSSRGARDTRGCARKGLMTMRLSRFCPAREALQCAECVLPSSNHRTPLGPDVAKRSRFDSSGPSSGVTVPTKDSGQPRRRRLVGIRRRTPDAGAPRPHQLSTTRPGAAHKGGGADRTLRPVSAGAHGRRRHSTAPWDDLPLPY